MSYVFRGIHSHCVPIPNPNVTRSIIVSALSNTSSINPNNVPGALISNTIPSVEVDDDLSSFNEDDLISDIEEDDADTTNHNIVDNGIDNNVDDCNSNNDNDIISRCSTVTKKRVDSEIQLAACNTGLEQMNETECSCKQRCIKDSTIGQVVYARNQFWGTSHATASFRGKQIFNLINAARMMRPVSSKSKKK